MASQEIKIKLKSYDHRLIDRSALEIVEAAKRTGVKGYCNEDWFNWS